MGYDRRRAMAALGAGTLLALGVGGAHAQASDVLRIIVGFPPGGAVDVLARQVAQSLQEQGITTLVDNRAGAAGRLATDQLMAAPPDGRTLWLTPGGNLTIYPHVYRQLRYDPFKDLVPVAGVAQFGFGLAVGPGTPARTLKEFVEWGRANPGKASYATPGAGTAMHFLGVMLGRDAQFDYLHVPYKGGAPAITDAIGGSVPSVFATLGPLVGQHQAGRLRVLAISGERPVDMLPGVPTFEQAGYPNMTLSEHFAMFAPRGTPPGEVARLNEAINRAVQSDNVRAALAKMAFEPLVLSPQALGTRLREEFDLWGPVVRATGYTVDE